MSIQPGESMFFQVRSNDGTTIALRPYVQAGNINNPILLKCADCGWSSGNRAEYHNGGFMMKEQMSISRQSILDMGRVDWKQSECQCKYSRPYDKDRIAGQCGNGITFENYMVDQHAIVDEMDLAMNQLGRLLGDADLGEEQSF